MIQRLGPPVRCLARLILSIWLLTCAPVCLPMQPLQNDCRKQEANTPSVHRAAQRLVWIKMRQERGELGGSHEKEERGYHLWNQVYTSLSRPLLREVADTLILTAPLR